MKINNKYMEENINTIDESLTRLNELNYKDIFEANHSVMLIIDPVSGNIIDANNAACEFYGWTHYQICKKKIFEINTLTEVEVKAEMQLAISEKRNYFNFKHRLANGDVRDVEVYSGSVKYGLKSLLYSVIHDISNKKIIEDKLRLNEEKYRSIFESIQDVFYVADREGTILEISPSIEILSKGQYTYKDIIGRSIKEFYKNTQARDDFYKEIQKYGSVTDYELTLINKDGKEVPVAISSRFIYNEMGVITKILGSVRDISVRKQAEIRIQELNETLEQKIEERTILLKKTNEDLLKEIGKRNKIESELALEKQRLAAIIESNNVGTWECNVQTGETSYNDRYAEIIGYELDDISPVSVDTWRKFAHPEDLIASDKIVEKHFKGELDFYEFEARMKHKNGEWVWVLAKGKVNKWDNEGKPLIMSGTHQDITKRKKDEENLRWNQSLLNLMSNASPLGFLVVDNRTDDILYFNHRFCQIWEIEQIEEGMKRGEFKNNDIIPFCLPILVDIPAFAESCKPLQKEENRDTFSDEIAFTKNRTIHRYSTQIRGTNDEYFGRFYIFEDVTQRKHSVEFENELLKLSVQMMGITKDGFSSALNNALFKIGTLLGADRAYIFEMDDFKETMSNTYEWCNEGVSREIDNLQNIPISLLPKWMETLSNFESIHIKSVKDLPESWDTEKNILEPQGIQSLIVTPILNNNELIGFIGLDVVKEQKSFSDTEISNLKLWSNILAGIINKQKFDIKLDQTRQNYETFFNTIDDFLFVLDEQGNIIHTNNTVVNRLGFSKDELENKSVLMLHPEERREEAGRIVMEMLSGKAEFCPVPLITKLGDKISVETRVKPGIWDGKSVIFGVTKDVSKIKLSEEKFSRAFHLNSSLMAISNFETDKFIDVNKTFLNTLGFSKEEVIGNTSKSLNIFIDYSIRNKVVKKLIEKESVRSFEVQIRTKIGKVRVGLFSADLIFIGKELCLLTMMVDITERKIAEESLRESELRFSLFMDYLPDLVFIKDSDSKMLYTNRAINEALGASKWIGLDTNELFDKEIAERILSDDKNILETGYNKIEESFVNLDGKLHQYETQKFVIPLTDQKKLIGGISIDVTEHNRAYEQLQSKIALLEAQKNATPNGILIIDKDLEDILLINDNFIQIFNVPVEVQNGQNYKRLLNHITGLTIDPVKFSKKVDYLHNHQFKTVTEEFGLIDGTILDIFTAPVIGKDEKYYGRIWSFKDISKRKSSEAELIKAKYEAEKANLAKSEFLSRMSHELRTPMNSILGFGQLLQMDELSHKQRKNVNHIVNNGRHLLELINEVLDISGIESGKQSLLQEPVKLDLLINEMLELVQYSATQRQITLELNESPINQTVIMSDKKRVKQVLINLLDNAIKYNKIGGFVKVAINLVPNDSLDNSWVKISIIDSGIGIKQEDTNKLFEPFERLDADKTDTEGTGLGLTVVKKIVGALGGKIGVESELGIGSNFWIVLPLFSNIQSNIDSVTNLSNVQICRKEKKGTILYFEDSVSNIELVSEIILSHRPSINLVANRFGSQAVKFAIDYSPDLILLDIDLPDIDGMKVLQLLMQNELTRSIPVIIVSADAIPEHKINLQKQGAKDYLSKPLDVSCFIEVVDKWVIDK